MAVDKLVDSTQLDADLTTVANAIRTKGGTSAQLAFPAGFKSAIEAIPTGGGETYPDLTDAPIPEGYLEVVYVVIDASAGLPHSSTVTTSTNMKGVRERGTYSNGVWTTISSTTFEGGQTIDWSDTQSGYVFFRFLITHLTSNMHYLDATTPTVAVKLWSTNLATYWKLGDVFSMRHMILAIPNWKPGVLKTSLASLIGDSSRDGLIPLLEKIDAQGSTIGSLTTTHQIWYSGMQNMVGLKSILFPTNQTIQYVYARLNYAFTNCLSLEELDMSMWRMASSVTMADYVFDGCIKLKTLDLSNWDLSHVTTANNIFRFCFALETVTLTNAIFPPTNLSFAYSSKLTDTSLVSIANALPVSNKTLTLHATPKAKLSTIMGTVADGAFTADESGDTTLLSFINNTKGWTVA